MDDLTRCLYDFVNEKRMGSIHQDPEYRAAAQSVERQTEKAKKGMSKKQLRELRLLIDSMIVMSSVESEHLFQATLRLAGELGQAVGTS